MTSMMKQHANCTGCVKDEKSSRKQIVDEACYLVLDVLTELPGNRCYIFRSIITAASALLAVSDAIISPLVLVREPELVTHTSRE